MSCTHTLFYRNPNQNPLCSCVFGNLFLNRSLISRREIEIELESNLNYQWNLNQKLVLLSNYESQSEQLQGL